jgi:hypothetical protein
MGKPLITSTSASSRTDRAFAWQNAMRRVLNTLALVGFGCLLAFGLATLILMTMPHLVFGATEYRQRMSPSQSMEINFRPADGDLFAAMPGSIKPPEDNAPLVQFTIGWDADGFRLPAKRYNTYPIAIFGDSFTEGFNVERPYPDVLAAALDVGVYNYGYRAYGPSEVAEVAQQFAYRPQREWVLYGYFSGNDLGDTVRPPKLDARTIGSAWQALFDRFNPPLTDPYRLPAYDHYDFPKPVIIGSRYYDMAFLWYYWWWQRVPLVEQPAFIKSKNVRILDESLETIAASAPDACKALVFIPTKEQLYYPYIFETERQWILGNANTLVLDEENTIRIIPEPLSQQAEPAFVASLTGQHDLIRELISTKPGWTFIDLLPAFANAVANGELLYYAYDSHWNQAGHDLAGQIIAQTLRDQPCMLPAL